MSKKILSLFSIFFLMLFTLVACGKEGKITIQVDDKMEVGQTYQVKYELEGIKDSVKLTWTVSDPEVAKLDSSSLTIEALKEGSFTLTVTAESGETASKKVIVEKGEEPVHNHTEEVIPGKAATCKETGLTEGKKCAECGEILVAQQEIAKLPHTEEVLAGKAATCKETGLTEGKKCSKCGEVLVEQTEIKALGHEYEEGKCIVCGAADPDYKPENPVVPEPPKPDGVYGITYEVYEGILLNAPTEYDGTKDIVLPTPTLEKHKFLGWYETPEFTGEKVEKISSGSTGDKKFYAKWEKEVTYSISYDLDGGRWGLETPVTEYTSNSDMDLPSPTKDDYSFDGWYDEYDQLVEKIDINTSGDLNLTARWSEKKYYIIFNCDGGSPISPLELKVGEKIEITENPTKDYCFFIEWENLPEYMPKESIYIKAKWYDFREYFEISGNVITKYIGTDTDVVIPDYYYLKNEKIEITVIGKNAFERKDITSIKLPDSIVTIEREAFSNCFYLEKINFPASLTIIGYMSFSNTALENVILPNGLRKIEREAFSSCSKLTSMVIPDSVEEIGLDVLSMCSKLKTLTLPFIGEKRENPTNTYMGYIFGEKLMDLGFILDTIVEEITLTGGEVIYEKCFYNFNRLRYIHLPNTIKEIKDRAFGYCVNLQEVILPDSVEIIEKRAFIGAGNLQRVILNEGLKSIGESAFFDFTLYNTSLDDVKLVIPSTVEYIGPNAFYGLFSTTKIYCSLEKQPDTWDKKWNMNHEQLPLKVIWGVEK